LITERAARFSLASGLDHAGRELLAEARQHYAAWGASAKVDQLDWAYATLQVRPDGTTGGGDPPTDLAQQRGRVTTGTLDLLGILAASQALSSETSIDSLHTRVVEILSAMTGATSVQLLLWNPERHVWLLPTPDSATGTAQIFDTTDRAAEPLVPLSVLRYVQRTEELLVVSDVTADDRFARDPYLADLACCSLLAVPVLSRGNLRAVLLLENRLIRAAFTTDRLDAVTLIAGQLAVSLDNAQLYEELTTSRARIVTTADQTRRRLERDLHDGAQQRLVSLALRLRMAQAAPPEPDELAAQLGDLANLATRGLPPALKALTRRAGVPVELDVRLDGRLPEQIEVAAYYLVAEALTNAAKHAHASVAHVTVDTAEDDAGGGAVLRVRVRDDGRGGADLTGGSGLLGLKDRAEALGGRLMVLSAPGAGTSVQAELPLSRANAVPGPPL
jgi:signal transduction histidine kinase